MEISIIQQWFGIITAGAAIIGIVLGFLRWIVSNIVRDIKKNYLDEIKHELQSNSGTSVKDQVTRLETNQIKISVDLESTKNEVENKIQDTQDRLHEKIDANHKEVHESVERIYQLIIQKL